MPPLLGRLAQTSPATAATAVLAAAAVAVVVEGLPGLIAGLLAGTVVAAGVSRLEPAAQRRHREQMVADLPLACDLLAACLAAGQPPGAAVEIVAEATAGPLSDALSGIGARLRLGADPRQVWQATLDDPVLALVGRAVSRSLQSGAALTPVLQRVAADARLAARSAAETRARAVASKSAAPLGLCFLPAFLLVGIVPVVASGLATIVG